MTEHQQELVLITASCIITFRVSRGSFLVQYKCAIKRDTALKRRRHAELFTAYKFEM